MKYHGSTVTVTFIHATLVQIEKQNLIFWVSLDLVLYNWLRGFSFVVLIEKIWFSRFSMVTLLNRFGFIPQVKIWLSTVELVYLIQ